MMNEGLESVGKAFCFYRVDCYQGFAFVHYILSCMYYVYVCMHGCMYVPVILEILVLLIFMHLIFVVIYYLWFQEALKFAVVKFR